MKLCSEIFFSARYDWIIQIALKLILGGHVTIARANLPVLACNVVASKVEREVDYRVF